MSILANKETRVVIQGGQAGVNAALCLFYAFSDAFELTASVV